MKIGNKILFTNGRGNYKPWNYMFGNSKHGSDNTQAERHFRKGLWSKIRKRTKLNITNEIYGESN